MCVGCAGPSRSIPQVSAPGWAPAAWAGLTRDGSGGGREPGGSRRLPEVPEAPRAPPASLRPRPGTAPPGMLRIPSPLLQPPRVGQGARRAAGGVADVPWAPGRQHRVPGARRGWKCHECLGWANKSWLGWQRGIGRAPGAGTSSCTKQQRRERKIEARFGDG